jgi:hypothetical protein
MKRFFLVFLLTGAVSMLSAQNLQKTALTIEKFKSGTGKHVNSAEIRGFGSDENNYYMYYGGGIGGKFDASFFVINKNLKSIKEFPLTKDKDDRFLWVQAAEDDMIILLARDKKGEQRTQIIKQAYAKTTGSLKKETVIATFPSSKLDHWYFYSSTSPDKTKKCFLFLTANKKNSVDSYYAAVLNQDCEVEWGATHDLEVSNESFNVGDVAVTNKSDMYIAFISQPKDEKKSSDKNSYIDLIYLSDGSKDKMNFRICEKYYEGQIKLKALKNNDLYMAGIFSPMLDNYFISIKIDGSNFNVLGEYKQLFEEFKKVELGEKYSKPTNTHNMKINSIFELNNGDIAVLGEQTRNIVHIMNGATSGYTKERGSVTTFFIKKDDASIDYTSIIEKKQSNLSTYDYPVQALHLSIFAFVYGNKVGYIFNDCLKKYATPEKYKEQFFRSADGKDVCIVFGTQENGEKAKITLLTGSQLPANRLVRQILFQEDNRLIVLTRNTKGGYIETLSLP